MLTYRNATGVAGAGSKRQEGPGEIMQILQDLVGGKI
jgi:hypothetical protein